MALLCTGCGGSDRNAWTGAYKSRSGVELLRVRVADGQTWASVPMGQGGGAAWFVLRAKETATKDVPALAAASGNALVPDGFTGDVDRAPFVLCAKYGSGQDDFGDYVLFREGSTSRVAKGEIEGAGATASAPADLIGAFGKAGSEGATAEAVTFQNGGALVLATHTPDAAEMERRWGVAGVLQEQAVEVVPDTKVAEMFGLSQDDAHEASALTPPGNYVGGKTVLFSVDRSVKIKGVDVPAGVALFDRPTMFGSDVIVPLSRLTK